MSCVELHTGTLTKINTKGLTVEEYCEFLCKKYGYEIAYEGDTYAETLMDVDDTYKVLNGELYKCDDIQKTLPIWLTLEVMEMELTSTLSHFTMEALG
jgi:hypothetical protein